MNKIDAEILNINKNICKNIEKHDPTERGFLSQNILSQLRNFVEDISLKSYSNGNDIEITYGNIKKANNYVKTESELNFLGKFHKLLQASASHYTLDEENSERLMLKYYEYLLKIKSLLKSRYNMNVLDNIDKFPINLDSNLKEYYEKIAARIDGLKQYGLKNVYNDRYYIQKIKPFFVANQVYYEVTFTTASDKASKFDRVIAFTRLNISNNYAVKLSIKGDNINVLGKNMPIRIIDDWNVSIRPCELNNLADIFSGHRKIQGVSTEYNELMAFLKKTGLNLVEFIEFTDEYYLQVKNQITQKAKATYIFNLLDKCRELIKSNGSGSNVIRYLLYRLNNKVIKKQYYFTSCDRLSDLYLSYKCIPFDEMPFNSSLVNHNPKISDLFDCLDINGREHEILARYIKNNTENKAQLYTPKKDITSFEDIDKLIELYNSKLYYKHGNRRLENYKDNIYIRGYEEDTIDIIQKLKDLSLNGVDNYTNSVDSWLQTSSYVIDCEEKKKAIRQMFEVSRVALIYGSAGTGKSTIINHISNFFNDKKKLYLANTNPAVDNLKRRVNTSNCTFNTIAKFVSTKNNETEFDLLFIDECSTVSNLDMLNVLNKATFKLLIIIGDIFQIESIIFGNWFSVARSFIPKTSVFELTKPYRSTNPNLITLWNKVRNVEDDILEHITKNKYSVSLNESIFEHSEEDEIILCLNYDGLYGINNINIFLQSSNKNPSVQWGILTYKVGDPILFNESERFAPLIYNNLKGKIINIVKFEDRIQFDIEIDKVITQLDAEDVDFELVGNSVNGNSIIRFWVNKYKSTDDDDDDSSDTIVPFQVAYAVSIHKAQGLEYNSVKIVITDEIEEMISHNIFYTAITRAKNKLKIYWTPETEKKILSRLEHRMNKRDVAFLSTKFNSK
ncbi:ATP-dependent DNA helicase [Clostridium beijerinckii]|uniref:ATP-dependent DNA helicase n=1 Tax=Clostridium beijerinckii TaxID=1520 RepID=UPI00156D9114|nr:ATP-dependent RecD-like DNA helicase [Clostridium beijerinckii]NRT75131.1 energy-coupling factor transporter ATP-binding protein EcfA2 [Clostridium beijerinckii]